MYNICVSFVYAEILEFTEIPVTSHRMPYLRFLRGPGPASTVHCAPILCKAEFGPKIICVKSHICPSTPLYPGPCCKQAQAFGLRCLRGRALFLFQCGGTALKWLPFISHNEEKKPEQRL